MQSAIELRCKGCGRHFGFTTQKTVEAALYCSDECVEFGSLSPLEERDDLLVEIYRERTMTLEQIAEQFGLSRQRVHQIVKERATLSA